MTQAAETLARAPRDGVIGRIGPVRQAQGRPDGWVRQWASDGPRVVPPPPAPALLPIAAIETTSFHTSRPGVVRYQVGLLRSLRELDPAPFDFKELAAPADLPGPGGSVVPIGTVKHELWAWAASPGLVRQSGAALLHATDNPFMRPPAGVRHVVTLHDLACIIHPERFDRWQVWAERWRCLRLKHADRVICLTRAIADTAIRLIGLPARKIEVIHPGCDIASDITPTYPRIFPPIGIPRPIASLPGGLDQTALPTEFFLFVGTPESSSELALLRGAYQRARDDGSALPPLVIVGPRPGDVAFNGKLPDDWHFVSPAGPDELAQLYRQALALVFPGMGEGFSYPLLEAMSLGCPVICSRAGSPAEIVAEAGLFAPAGPAGYLAAMHSLAADETLRHELIRLGDARAEQFSWQRCASETSAVYASLLGR
jgi:glycosyltransferase involved in cell wall biosynthesis